MELLPVRLPPGADLRLALETLLHQHQSCAAYVLQGIGSLSVAQLRLAGRPAPSELRGDLEILTLAGPLSPDGAHLHMSVADADGQVTGGHACAGCTIRTTAEILIALLSQHRFRRMLDDDTGFPELAIARAHSQD